MASLAACRTDSGDNFRQPASVNSEVTSTWAAGPMGAQRCGQAGAAAW